MDRVCGSGPADQVGGIADVTCPDTTCFALGIQQTGPAANNYKVGLLTNT